SEVYVYFEIDEMDVPDKTSKLNFPRGLLQVEGEDRKDYIEDLLKGERVDSTRFGVSAYDMKLYRNVKIHNKYSEFDADKKEYFVNMGYFEESPSEFTLHFADLGTYKLKDIQVYSQEMGVVDEKTKVLAENTIHDLVFDRNLISGKIEVPDHRLLFMSIPYSKGWRAYVDGVETEVHQTNVLGLGIELEPGEHEVVFKYFTPYLKEGAIISLIGLIGFIAIMILYNRDRKKSQKE
ncbi:MAG: YfhO family protein, partial [Lachnospiraceae bacterium]|nr:YfhO family protein [Lachnospiraceae bacterium]